MLGKTKTIAVRQSRAIPLFSIITSDSTFLEKSIQKRPRHLRYPESNKHPTVASMASSQESKECSPIKARTKHGKSIEGEMLCASSTVPEKYRGTIGDKDDMKALGKIQVLRRNFKFPTMLAFASTVLVAWEILPVISVYALQNGGTPIVFWGIVVGIFGMTFVYASLAEMASMFPTAGGQYRKSPTP